MGSSPEADYEPFWERTLINRGTLKSLELEPHNFPLLGYVWTSPITEEIPIIEIPKNALLPCGRNRKALCFVLVEGSFINNNSFTDTETEIDSIGFVIGQLETLSGASSPAIYLTTSTTTLMVLDRERLLSLCRLSQAFSQKLILSTEVLTSHEVRFVPTLSGQELHSASCAKSEFSNGGSDLGKPASYVLGEIACLFAASSADQLAAGIAVGTRVIRESVRPYDEFFVDEWGTVRIVLPDADETAAYILSRRIADRLSRAVVHDGMEIPMPHVAFKLRSVGKTDGYLNCSESVTHSDLGGA